MATPPAPTRTLAADIDPVRFEVIRNALLAITEEMGTTLRRAAYSTNIKTRGDPSAAPAVKGRREVWFAEAGGFRATTVLGRGKLLRGNVIDGPAIIEEHDASTLVHPGWTATVDEHANLVLAPSRRIIQADA